MKIKYPSLLWNIRRWTRYKDFFNYWTRFRRKEENCCPRCGVINDNSPYWKRKIVFIKREDKKLSEMSLTELAMIKTLEEEWTKKVIYDTT